jgi:hypothetical protein
MRTGRARLLLTDLGRQQVADEVGRLVLAFADGTLPELCATHRGLQMSLPRLRDRIYSKGKPHLRIG